MTHFEAAQAAFAAWNTTNNDSTDIETAIAAIVDLRAAAQAEAARLVDSNAYIDWTEVVLLCVAVFDLYTKFHSDPHGLFTEYLYTALEAVGIVAE